MKMGEKNGDGMIDDMMTGNDMKMGHQSMDNMRANDKTGGMSSGDYPAWEDRYSKDHSDNDDKDGDKKKHKIKSMDDVSEELEKDFAEEIADAKKYWCMSKVAGNAGEEHDSQTLLEIATDEYSHAYYIHDYMERHGIDIPDELEEKYKKLTKEMEEFF